MKYNEKASEFLSKLEALLREYSASIEACCGESTDTHGIEGAHMVVNVGEWNSRERVSVKVCDGWEIEAANMKEEKKQ